MNKRFKINKKNSSNSLAIRMIFSLILGLLVGIVFLFLRESLTSSGRENVWNIINNLLFQDISVPEGQHAIGIFYILGQLFINALQLIIVPMIFASITLSMCHISDTRKLGRISVKTLSGFLTTSIFALIVAGIFAFLAHTTGIFSVNIHEMSSVQANSGSNPLLVLIQAVPNNIFSVFTSNSMVLSIVFLAVVTGLCINKLGNEILVLKKLLQDINNIITIFLNFVINKLGPIAIFVLIARTFAVYGVEHLKPAFAYMLTVAAASILFLFTGYPLFVYIKTKLNPFIFMKKMAKVALLGFSAASSAAALSLNKKTAVEELGVDEDIAAFILPLGMTINMNGTAIMQVIAAVFIASTSGYEIGVSNIFVIALLALISSVGTPSAPGASSIILFSILTGMGYNNPATVVAYSLIIAINRPIDMLITCLNVIGDGATAVVVAKSENLLNEDIFNS